MMKALRKFLTLENLVIFLLAAFLWSNFVTPMLSEGFCGCYEPGAAECSKLAQTKCCVTEAELGQCWMPRFKMCQTSSPYGTATNCHEYASNFCGGVPSGAGKCFVDTHKQCMEAKGLSGGC